LLQQHQHQHQHQQQHQHQHQQDDIYDIYDRALLYDDYKTTLEGYVFKKKKSKTCSNCGIEKILMYSEGMYVCLKCGEVENYIVESELTNFKDTLVEKPTFPYKRKNHFCEWIYKLKQLLVKVILKKITTQIIVLN
jgi:ribosomal protein S27AE